MTSIDLPLQIVPKGMKREERLKNSIDSAIHLIMTTARFSTPIDPQFGFVFNNLRFEMFNENQLRAYLNKAVGQETQTELRNNQSELQTKKERVSEIDNVFGVQIRITELDPENFNSAEAIWQLVQTLKNK